MKNWIKKTAVILAITFAAFSLQAQMPPEPNGGNDPGSGNDPVGGGASIGGGIAILLALGAGYGTKKIYDFSKRKIAE